MSCRQLAEEFNVPLRPVQERCSKEKWREAGRIAGIRKESDSKCKSLALPDSPDQLQAMLQKQTVEEGVQWIARIESAWKRETRVNAIQALKQLVPLWKTVRDMVAASTGGEPTARAANVVSVNFVTGNHAPPRLVEGREVAG
jgi:hypothetical protein